MRRGIGWRVDDHIWEGHTKICIWSVRSASSCVCTLLQLNRFILLHFFLPSYAVLDRHKYSFNFVRLMFTGNTKMRSWRLCLSVMFTRNCTEACFSLHSFLLLLLLLLSLDFILSLEPCHLLSRPLLSSFYSSLLSTHPSATIEAIEAIETVKDEEGKIPLMSQCVCVRVCVCACACMCVQHGCALSHPCS